MNLKSTSALILAGAVLAGCGSSGGSSSSSAFGGIYEPNVRDGSNNEYNELENGIVYFIGNLDGTVSEVRVTIDRAGTTDASDDTLFVEIDGADARAFNPISGETTDVAGTSLSGAWVAADGSQDEFSVSVNQSDLFSSAFLRINNAPTALGGFNAGFGGLETADLPDSATYSGEFQVDTTNTTSSGGASTTTNVNALDTSTTNTVVDFANGTITGEHNGTSFIGANGAVSGDIDGTVSGTRVVGTLSVEGAATGTLDFGGLATGSEAANIRGGVGGTLDFGGSTGSEAVGGAFCLAQTGSCSAD